MNGYYEVLFSSVTISIVLDCSNFACNISFSKIVILNDRLCQNPVGRHVSKPGQITIAHVYKI